MKKMLVRICCLLVAGIVVIGGLIVSNEDLHRNIASVLDVGSCMVMSRAVSHTVEERIEAIEKKKPWLKTLAKGAEGHARILVFKKERMLEVSAPGWRDSVRKYPMTGFSGALGPKLKEGDGQIPEGVYGVEYLNPNSRFYLSLKVSYPNSFDREKARCDGRKDLGGDIMIHGKNVTIGCVPVGDDAIEDIFYLVHSAGIQNTTVVISPYDMRQGRKPELENSSVPWYGELLDVIEKEIGTD